MWPSLSVSRWSCLLTLAVVMLFSASQVDSIMVPFSCCDRGQLMEITDIKKCFEQKPRVGCQHHYFVIVTNSNKEFCVKPAAQWLQKLLKAGELNCPLTYTNKRRFEVLDKYYME